MSVSTKKQSVSGPFTRLYRFVRHDKDKRLLYTLQEQLSGYLQNDAISEVERAYEVGAKAHAGQLRAAGDKYITHPLEVALLLAGLELDSDIIVAAILHDTLEDTALLKENLVELFGNDVANLVDGVSKADKVEAKSKMDAEIENIHRLFLAMIGDRRVGLIKLADRLHNMRTLNAFNTDKRKRIAKQTLEIYVPLARVIGMFNWHRELEDLCFKYLHPNRYEIIGKAVKQGMGIHSKRINKEVKAMQKVLDEWEIEATISGREKNLYALYKKMKLKNNRLSQVQDVFACRIIVKRKRDCYLALGAIHNHYKPISGEFADYIAIPKMNGYQSLHTTVYGDFSRSLEVQIRTEKMHTAAEYGIASHLRYKASVGSLPEDGLIPGSDWFLDLPKILNEDDSPSEVLEKIKRSLYQEEVYVLTPKGDVKRLPKGSTVVDFAYSIHTKLGDAARSAVINGEPASLHAILSNSDSVEIKRVNNKNAKPDAAWLKFAVSGKARTAIRNSIKETSRRDREKMGEKQLKLAIRNRKVRVRDVTQKMKNTLIKNLEFASWEDLLNAIAMGERNPEIVAKQLFNQDQMTGDNSTPLAIFGTEGLAVAYATCCNPIPNEPIVGLSLPKRGFIVHAENCNKLSRYNYEPDRWHKLHWAKFPKGVFSVPIRAEIINKPGVMGIVSTLMGEMNANIDKIKGDTVVGGSTRVDFIIEVNNGAHLNKVLKVLQEDAHVERVARLTAVPPKLLEENYYAS